jgi:hypothetical protein
MFSGLEHERNGSRPERMRLLTHLPFPAPDFIVPQAHSTGKLASITVLLETVL